MKTVNKNQLYKHVKFLTEIYPYRNYKNIKSLRVTADYIEERLRKTGLKPIRQSWMARENKYENIMAAYQPEKEKRFVLGAHYDVYKDQPGADDNASSVAGLIEIAGLLQENKPELDYGIDFVSFCLEEPPFFKKKEMGSYVHAKNAAAENQQIIGMISMEMIGYYEDAKGSANPENNYLMVSGIKKYDHFNKHISQLLKQNGGIDSRRLSYADDYRNNGPSDHRNYWEFNYPAVMIIGSGGGGNPHYHKPTDTIDTLNFDTMTKAVNSIAYAVTNFGA